MKQRIHNPISKIISVLLTVLLVFNLVPEGAFRTLAEGEELHPTIVITIAYKEDGKTKQASVDGTYKMTVPQDATKGYAGSFTGGQIIITDFEAGYYELTVSLGTTGRFAYDAGANLFLKSPGPVPAKNYADGDKGTLICKTIAVADHEGTVADEEGNPLSGVTVSVTELGGYQLSEAITAQTGEDGRYRISLPDLGEADMKAVYTKENYRTVTFSGEMPKKNKPFEAVSMTELKDTVKPVFLFPDDIDYGTTYYNANGMGGAGANACYFVVKDGTPAYEDEPVSGVQYLYVSTGDYGNLENAIQAGLQPIAVTDGYCYESAVTEGTTYVYYLVDGAGNVSERRVTYQKDKESPKITNIDLFADAEGTSKEGINTGSGGFYSQNTMYLHVTTVDGGSGVRCVEVYQRVSADGIFSLAARLTPDANGKAVMAVTAEKFPVLTELAVVVKDGVNNQTELKTIAELGLARSAVAVSGGTTITEVIEGSSVNPANGAPMGVFRVPPKFTVTFTDLFDVGIKNVQILINGKALTADENGSLINASAQYASGQSFVIFYPKDAEGNLLLQEGVNRVEVSCENAAGTPAAKAYDFYWDTEAPQISRIEISTESEEDTYSVQNGVVYSNGPLLVTVTAADGAAASGLSSVVLYDGEEVLDTATVSEGGKAVFRIPSSFEDGIQYHFNLSLIAKDNLGNETARTILTPENSNAGTGDILISSNKAVINFAAEEGTELNGMVWYAAAPSVKVSLQDGFAGIRSVRIAVNGKAVEGSPFNFDTAVSDAEFDLNLSDYAADENGGYLIAVAAINGAGAASSAQKTYYADSEGPVVQGFEISAAEGSSVKETAHGIYAAGQAVVKVSASDNLTGVSKIVLLADDAEILSAQPASGEAFVCFTIDEALLHKDGVRRHKISAYAVDLLGNSGQAAIFTETDASQEIGGLMFDEAAPVISAEVAEGTPEGTVIGEGEEAKIWYSSDLSFVVDVSDESGIGTLYVMLNGIRVSLDADGNEIPDDLSALDKPYPIKTMRIATSQVAEASDCRYELVVMATDLSGNAAEVFKKVVYIDDAAPEVKGFEVSGASPETALNGLSYGAFLNGPVSVKVYFADDASNRNAGVTEVRVYLNGELYKTVTPEAGTDFCELTFPEDAIPDGFLQSYLISASVSDASGKESGIVALSADNSNLSASGVTIEKIPPEISVALPEQGRYVLDEDRIWYADDVEFTVSAKDADAGLYTLEVLINGVKIDTDANGTAIPEHYTGNDPLTESPAYRFRTADYPNEAETFTVEVIVTDAAGNRTEYTETIRIDRKKPVVTGFSLKPEAEADIIHYLSFGTFYNGRMILTVSVSDDEPASGAEKVTLLLNGTEQYAVSDVVNGVATFVIPAGELSAAVDAFTLAVVARDRCGNTGEMTQLNSGTIPEMQKEEILIETTAPVVTVTRTAADGASEEAGAWNTGDVKWAVKAVDTQSGIGSVSVTMNGTPIKADIHQVALDTDFGAGEEPVYEISFELDSSQVSLNKDNGIVLEIAVCDNAGNVSEVYTDFYGRDNAAPEVTAFSFQPQGGTETGASGPSVSETEYGYFFSRDTRVRVTAKDTEPGSGIASVTYYLRDKDGVETEEQTVVADANGDAFFTVKAPFKGRIYAKATDRASNTGEYAASKGIIVENAEFHNEGTHLQITKPAATGMLPGGVEMYRTNVDLLIRVTDKNAGIKSVEWSISPANEPEKNQTGSVSVNESGALNGEGGWTIDGTEGNLVTDLSKTLVVSQESNEITVRVRMRDNAGNVTERQLVFGIDKGIPEVSYSFEGAASDADHTNVFNQSRTMTIVVNEKNFSPSDFVITVKNSEGTAPEISGWSEEKDPNDPNVVKHTATVRFIADGTYSVSLSYADRAGNRATIAQVPGFIIDRTRPVISVSFDNRNVSNGNYYNGPRTATITVMEKNFDVSRVVIEGNAQETGLWSASGDIHTMTVAFTEDGVYNLRISATDRAGNTAETIREEEFIIDTTVPVISLSNIEDANRGEVAPVIVCLDDNFDPDGIRIQIVHDNGAAVNLVSTKTEIQDETRSGLRITYKNFDPMKEVDGFYTIRVSAVDKAGNVSEEIVKSFSVNRFGSTYELKQIENLNGNYSTTAEDLVISEVNVDEIDTDSIEVSVVRNSVPKKLVKGKDYTVEKVEGSGKTWNEYRYVISKEVFNQDGEYSIRILSKDIAGNINQNDERGKDGMISFCIDRIAPEISVISPVEGSSYAQTSVTGSVEIRDNYRMESVRFVLDGMVIPYSQTDDLYTFEIPESDMKQTLIIIATDAAGNEKQIEIKDILVTSNLLIRFVHNPAAIISTVIGVLVLLAIAILLIRRRRNSY